MPGELVGHGREIAFNTAFCLFIVLGCVLELDAILPIFDADFYLCGPSGWMASISEALEGVGSRSRRSAANPSVAESVFNPSRRWSSSAWRRSRCPR